MDILWILASVVISLCTYSSGTPVRTYDRAFSAGDSSINLGPGSFCNSNNASADSAAPGLKFQTLIANDGNVYVGATNNILQLSAADLSLRSKFISGPGNDSEGCIGPVFCASGLCSDVQCTDNYNKLLLPYRDRLLACGTLQRTCDLLTLSDVATEYTTSSRLKCRDTSKVSHFTDVSTRNRTLPLVAAIYINNTQGDSDLLYLGQAKESFKTLIAPSSFNPYFSLIDDTQEYSLTNPNFITNTYKFVWTTPDYAFYLWFDGSSNTIRISRLCHRVISEQTRMALDTDGRSHEEGIRSYTEVDLSCRMNGLTLTNVITAKFFSGNLFVLLEGGGVSAICSSPLTNIIQHINIARQRCWDTGDSSYALPLSVASNRGGCLDYSTYADYWATCGFDKGLAVFLSPIRAARAINMSVDMIWPSSFSENPTSFAVGTENNMFSAFVGTNAGNVVKMPLGNASSLQSERITLSHNAVVLNSMVIAEDGQSLFTITEDRIFKVAVANCEQQYTTCEECMNAFDPYCGWCVLRSRCTRKSTCENSDLTNAWIRPASTSVQCPSVSVIEPNIVALGSSLKINLTFSGASLQANLDYVCQFSTISNQNAFTSSNLLNYGTSSTPQCMFTATASSSNFIPTGTDHVNVTLSIGYNGNVLATGQFRVYDCSRIPSINYYTMCTSCVTSEWQCNWCLESRTCSSSTCQSMIVTDRTDCPTVTSIANLSGPIPAGVGKEFQLGTRFLPLVASQYTCQFDFCGKVMTSNGILNVASGIVSCPASAQQLSCARSSSDLRVSLLTDGYVIDVLSASSVTATVFNCSVNTEACGKCIGFRRQFSQCAWCERSLTCIPSTACNQSPVTTIDQCSPPQILSISPLNGPSAGGTVITIQGSSLGSHADEITSVLAGSVECVPIPENYIPSVTIECRTSATTSTTYGGHVTVRTNYTSNNATSTDVFLFSQVAVVMYQPRVVLNESTIFIYGTNLNVGNQARIYLGRDVARAVTCRNRADTSMPCKLPPVSSPGEYMLSVQVDGYTKQFSTPVVFVNIPTYLVTEPLVQFMSGGGSVSLKLTSLDGVQKAALQIDQEQSQPCSLNRNESLVTCVVSAAESTTPTRRRRQAGTEIKRSAVLILNDLHRVDVGTVRYVTNPVLAPRSTLPCESTASSSTGSSNQNITRTDDQLTEPTYTIQITGSNFDGTNAVPADYTVSLLPEGTSDSLPCVVSYIESTLLFCRTLSSSLSQHTNKKLTIEVQIGNLQLISSEVLYCSGPDLLVVAITIPILVVLIFIILFLLFRYRKRVQIQRLERRVILSKLDDLENKTRDAGRKAYMELQLGYMNNLADNISDRITYLPPEMYFTQTLFNLTRGHPVLDKTALQNESTRTMEALEDWLKILNSSEFVITFIRTLEEQKHFTVQEKGNVASLLAVCLFSNLPYYTSIMLDLLSELIQKHVQRNPKLLLRRSESVVEKMVSHWLAITLYDECIREKSGKPMFLLTKAIHYMVGSAPCDVVANKSMNSLNEMTLLGSEISYDTVILHASIEEKDTGEKTSPVEVTVVNVDSITQTKAKVIDAVYKDRPYSECPKPDDLDFELLSGNDPSNGVILSDIDSVSVNEGNFTKINTLKHYNVPDKAVVVLRPKGVRSPGVSQDSTVPLLRSKSRQIYHLIHPREDETSNGYADAEDGAGGTKGTRAHLEDMINRPFQEIYLTRMVRSKTTLQKYVDEVFESVLCPDPIPHAVRYFFQYLDREAARYKINDEDVTHIWKTNSLLLRYWVNILKNPEFVFDTNKTAIVDSCLNVITQAFMDACTTTDRKLGQDSPSNKLLYARDAAHYKTMVNEFFVKVNNTSWMTEDEINELLRKQSEEYGGSFNKHVAAQQLYQYLRKYKDQTIEALRLDEHEIMAKNVLELMNKMEGNLDTATTIV